MQFTKSKIYSLFISVAVQVARICMVADGLAGPCTGDVGIAHSLGK